MSERSVLAHAADRGRKRLGDDEVAEHLDRVDVELLDRRVLVAAVEVAEEVATVATVHGEQPRRFRQRASDEAQPVVGAQVARRQPRVRRDDVRRDERVLEIERGEVAVGGQDLPPQPVLAVLAARPARGRAHTGVFHDGRQVHVV